MESPAHGGDELDNPPSKWLVLIPLPPLLVLRTTSLNKLPAPWPLSQTLVIFSFVFYWEAKFYTCLLGLGQ